MTPDMVFILPVLTGFISGVFVGAASGTAASLMIPILTVFMGFPLYRSIGTSLFVDCMIGLTAGMVFLKNKNIDIKSSRILIITGVAGAVVGSQLTAKTSQFSLNILIGLFLIIMGLNFIINGIRKNVDFVERKINLSFFRKHRRKSLIIFGLIIGFCSGFFGAGSGAMMAMVMIFILAYDVHTAIGTSLLVMFFIAGAGATSHFLNNEFILQVALYAGLSAIIGAFLSSSFANRIDEDKLGRFVGLIIFLLGFLMFVKLVL